MLATSCLENEKCVLYYYIIYYNYTTTVLYATMFDIVWVDQKYCFCTLLDTYLSFLSSV